MNTSKLFVLIMFCTHFVVHEWVLHGTKSFSGLIFGSQLESSVTVSSGPTVLHTAVAILYPAIKTEN